MNIAEIRKKAKEKRAGESIPLPGVEGDSCLPDCLPERESTPAPLSPDTPALSGERPALATKNLSQAPRTVTGDGEKEILTRGKDRLDQLFSWDPQEEKVLLDEAGSAFSDGKREEKSSRRWLVFSLAKEDYALDISVIREILKPREITEIPRVPAFLLGIISLRGSIIPIFDLKQRMGLGISATDEDSRIIVCQSGELLAGLLIDRITQVTSIQDERIEPPPAIFAGRDRALLDGVGRVDDEVLILLNLTNVLTIDTSGL